MSQPAQVRLVWMSGEARHSWAHRCCSANRHAPKPSGLSFALLREISSIPVSGTIAALVLASYQRDLRGLDTFATPTLVS